MFIYAFAVDRSMRGMQHVYYPGYQPVKIGPITTSRTELIHLSVAWLAIAVAFANVLSDRNLSLFPQMFLISAVAVGSGFFLHELGHKLVAQKYGCFAEFRAFFSMLAFAVVLSFSGMVFAAPGAVMIAGHPTKKQNGIISVAGPLVNLVLAYLFFILLFVSLSLGLSPILISLFNYGFFVNNWIAIFNLIPFGNFDGRKILAWNKLVYGALVAFALLTFIPGFIF
jgi:Zn-dependent protease